VSAELERIEQIIDASGVADIELLLPTGVRPRQLRVTTLLIGMTLAMRAGREAFLTEVHKTLRALPTEDQRRLGVIATWQHAEHRLTYRQVEYTFDRVTGALANDTPDGIPSERLHDVLDRLLEASVQVLGEPSSSSYAVDWTDQATWSLPPPKKPSTPATPAAANRVGDTTPGDHDGADAANDTTHQPPPTPGCADPEASWGHRRGDAPGQDDELFYGYYLQAATIVNDEHGPQVPELARRMHLSSCDHDPPAAFVPVLERMHQTGIPVGDVLVDSGYAYRIPQTWALPIRQLGASLIQDLHPNDRGPHGTHHGAICSNGALYCPATPQTLLKLGPLPRAASAEQTAIHDQQCAELTRYKLSPITRPDHDGYHRVTCPAAQSKLRCPHRPASVTLPNDRPTILEAPEHPPVCCTQQTITVPPSVNAKTTQKHDYPSAAHRTSYNRRTAAERTFATLTDRATNDLSRGWCRQMGLTPIALHAATALIARNIRIADAFTARQAANQRRADRGLPPKTRKRRRTTIHDLAAAHAP
jgi:hypothetical protein